MIEKNGIPAKLSPGEEAFVSVPLTGCICRNGHEPDESGFVYTSPSCLIHGLHWEQEAQGMDSSKRAQVMRPAAEERKPLSRYQHRLICGRCQQGRHGKCSGHRTLATGGYGQCECACRVEQTDRDRRQPGRMHA